MERLVIFLLFVCCYHHNYSRPSSNWHHVSLALCMDPTYNISAIAHKSFYSNIDATFSKYYEFCAVHQALDTDYKGNTETLHIDRGHLMPNGMANQVIIPFS